MPKKTLSQIQAQIEKLQKEAEAIRAKEIAEVVAKIRVAIDHYGLTAADLGLAGGRAKAAATAKAGAAAATRKTRKPSAPKKAPVIKYRDDAGHAWTGHGKRPGWFKAALESGKKAEDLLVKAHP